MCSFCDLKMAPNILGLAMGSRQGTKFQGNIDDEEYRAFLITRPDSSNRVYLRRTSSARFASADIRVYCCPWCGKSLAQIEGR